MAQPLQRKTVWTRQAHIGRRVSREERKPNLPGPYIYVGTFVNPNDPGNDPPQTTIDSPQWQNGWTYVGTSYVGFRHGLDGETEFVGTLDTTGATTGTVAFTLPGVWRPMDPYSFLTDLDYGSGSFNAARVSVATNGEVTVYFPINP